MQQQKNTHSLSWVLITSLAATTGCSKSSGGMSDWTKLPVKTVSATVKGLAFTIDLPEGMRQTLDRDDVAFDFHVNGRVYTPSFTISAGSVAMTLDDYVKFQNKVENWLRKDTLPDGYVVSYENPNYKNSQDYITYVHRAFGDQVLTCRARLTPSSPEGKPKDQVPTVEKACLSLKPAK